MVARDAGPAGGADLARLPGTAGSGASALFRRGQGVARGVLRRRQRLSARDRRRRRHRQGFPHLGGHGADGAAPARSWRRSETERQAKKALRAALVKVAAALGNTPAVCRKSYIHPSVIGAYLERRFRLETAQHAGVRLNTGGGGGSCDAAGLENGASCGRGSCAPPKAGHCGASAALRPFIEHRENRAGARRVGGRRPRSPRRASPTCSGVSFQPTAPMFSTQLLLVAGADDQARHRRAAAAAS